MQNKPNEENMNKHKYGIGLLLFLLAANVLLFFANNSQKYSNENYFLGKWLIKNKGLIVEIYAEQSKYSVKILEVKGSKNNKTKIQPGYIMIRDLIKQDSETLKNGKMQPPGISRSMNCTIEKKSNNQLIVAVRFGLIKKKEIWYRVE